jgi:hypothetical protein
MQGLRRILQFVGKVSAIMLIAGCAYQEAIRNLTPTEQQEFRAYSKVMTAKQVRTYLAGETAAARAAYLNEIGMTQRFQALAAQDRESVLAGYIRKSMSAEALHFLWGEPYKTKGRPGHYEYWFYRGSSVSLAETGDQHHNLGNQVRVLLVDGRVDDWADFITSSINDNTGGS